MTPTEKERLYIQYRGKVLGYIRSRVSSPDDAEDLCQDVFLKVYRSCDDFDASKSSPGTWIYSITRNTVIDFYRRSRPSEELPEDIPDGDPSPEESILRDEQLDELAEALEGLPANLTDIIVLHYYDRMTLTDIATRLGISYGAVKIRHNKALALLKKALKYT